MTPAQLRIQQAGLQQIADSRAEFVIGLDEVGTGALAGPASVGCVVARRGWCPGARVRDSKKLSPQQREKLVQEFLQPPEIEEGWVEHIRLSEFQNGTELKRAIERVFSRLVSQAMRYYRDVLIVADGCWAPSRPGVVSIALPKGDNLVPAVSAAAILAKVSRDALMRGLAKQYPGYGWERNAAYGTAEHLAAIEQLGLTPAHRRGVRPVKKAMAIELAAAKLAGKMG